MFLNCSDISDPMGSRYKMEKYTSFGMSIELVLFYLACFTNNISSPYCKLNVALCKHCCSHCRAMTSHPVHSHVTGLFATELFIQFWNIIIPLSLVEVTSNRISQVVLLGKFPDGELPSVVTRPARKILLLVLVQTIEPVPQWLWLILYCLSSGWLGASHFDSDRNSVLVPPHVQNRSV